MITRVCFVIHTQVLFTKDACNANQVVGWRKDVQDGKLWQVVYSDGDKGHLSVDVLSLSVFLLSLARSLSSTFLCLCPSPSLPLSLPSLRLSLPVLEVLKYAPK
jgi:hypothetical protein